MGLRSRCCGWNKGAGRETGALFMSLARDAGYMPQRFIVLTSRPISLR